MKNAVKYVAICAAVLGAIAGLVVAILYLLKHPLKIDANTITIVVIAGAIITEVIAVAFLMVQRDESKGWSLSCATSEIVGYDRNGGPVYTSSMSRFIALLGSIAVMWIYMGIGLEIILNNGDASSSLKDDEWFLFFGLALFAPYVANQARAAIVGARKDAPRDLSQMTTPIPTPEMLKPSDPGTVNAASRPR